MKKLLLLAFAFISLSALAQKNTLYLSVGPSVANPLDRAGADYFKTGYGGSIKALYGISRHGAIIASMNYMNFGSNAKPTIPSFSLSSFKVGYRSYIGNSNFFVQGDAGPALTSSNGYRKLVLATSAGLGYSLPVGKVGYLDIAPSFHYLKTQSVRNNFLELNVSYRFKLGKKNK